MQVFSVASTSSSFASSQKYATSSSSSRQSSQSPSSASVVSSQLHSRHIPSPSPLRHLLAEDNTTTSSSSSSSQASLHHAHPRQSFVAPPVPSMQSGTVDALGLTNALGASRLQKQKQAALDSQMKALYEAEYREDVLEYMYEMEGTTMANVELIDMQPELAWYMRPYLIDFLIEIHSQYRLRPETLFLAINIVDRYVSKRIVYKKHYQLVGCAALWIASKFEDAKDRVPTVEDLCAVCCSAYDQSAFIQMEGHVLSTIGWLLGHPTAEAWLRIACCPGAEVAMEDTRTQHVARFIMEITLFHRAFVPIKPSDIAQACLLLARSICAPNGQVQRKSEERADAVKIAQMLDAHLAEHLEQVSATVVKKYSPSFYSRASGVVREWYLSGHRFTRVASFSKDNRSLVHTSDVDMSPSSASSASGGRDSDYEHDDEEDYSTGPSSEPLTPSTSVCSSTCSSDRYDPMSVRIRSHAQNALHTKTASNVTLCVPTSHGLPDIHIRGAIHSHQAADDMQWQ